jgi:hypothetical protein
VVTTYKNIEACALLDGYRVDYIDPRRFRHVDCPGYNEVKLAIPREMGKKIEENHIRVLLIVQTKHRRGLILKVTNVVGSTQKTTPYMNILLIKLDNLKTASQ